MHICMYKYVCVYTHMCFNSKSCRDPEKFEFLTLTNLLCQHQGPDLVGIEY